MFSGFVTFCDNLWNWPSRKIGRFLWWLTGCSTALIGFLMFATGGMLRAGGYVLAHNYGMISFTMILNALVIWMWYNNFRAMHDMQYSEGDVLPREYASLYWFRRFLGVFSLYFIISGLFDDDGLFVTGTAVHIMGIHVAMMLWPQQPSLVRRLVTAHAPPLEA